MRQTGSFLIMFLLLIAYGRCVADQFGMLHTNEASCCQVVCQDDHCSDLDAASSHQTDHESHEDHEHHQNHGPEPEEPAPCHLCLIISMDGATFDGNIKVPTPQILESLDHNFFITLLDHALGLLPPKATLELPSYHDSGPPVEQMSQRLRIVSKALPVRGPSVA